MNRPRYRREDFFVYKKLLKVQEKKLRIYLRGQFVSGKMGFQTRFWRRKEKPNPFVGFVNPPLV